MNFKKILIIFLSLLYSSCGNSHLQSVSAEGGIDRSTASTENLLTPTVYYLPIFETSKISCPANEKKFIRNNEGKKMVELCMSQHRQCAIQGSCYIHDGAKYRMFNITAKIGNEWRFQEIKDKKCPFGFGSHSVCVDPNYSVAADQSIYPVGTVIYVDAIRGLVLANGETHTGYFIVRDEGGGIKGSGRFDFYTGVLRPTDPENFLAHFGLVDPEQKFKFQVVTGDLAQRVLESRGFPLLKKSVLEAGQKAFGL